MNRLRINRLPIRIITNQEPIFGADIATFAVKIKIVVSKLRITSDGMYKKTSRIYSSTLLTYNFEVLPFSAILCFHFASNHFKNDFIVDQTKKKKKSHILIIRKMLYIRSNNQPGR